MLEKVISGFQSGADIAGVIAAKQCGILTGGYIPKGFLTENGNKLEYKELYGAVEFGSKYPQRTLANVREADATCIFYRGTLERGSLLTKKYCDQLNKKCMTLDINYTFQHRNPQSNEDYLLMWLQEVQPKILNIAGNRESVAPGIEKFVVQLLTAVFKRYIISNN